MGGNEECSTRLLLLALLVILSIHFQTTYHLCGIYGFDDLSVCFFFVCE